MTYCCSLLVIRNFRCQALAFLCLEDIMVPGDMFAGKGSSAPAPCIDSMNDT